MKNISKVKSRQREHRKLGPECRLDYSKALPNRFSGKRGSKSVVVLLDSDVAKVFKDAESVNANLRALLTDIPLVGKQTKSRR